MLLAWIMTAVASLALAGAAPKQEKSEPAVPVYRVPGPAFEIPCKITDRTPDLVAVQLWVSADNGRTWVCHSEIKPDQTKFEYHAKSAGEYHFAPRMKFKDGRMLPPTGQLVATPRVAVEAGYDPAPPERSTLLAKLADELDVELTRLEFELIRKEVKRLAEEKGLTAEAAEKIDRLRSRLREAQNRLQNRKSGTDDGVVIPSTRGFRDPNLIPPPIPPIPVIPAPREVRERPAPAQRS
jgi:hypothetical protein